MDSVGSSGGQFSEVATASCQKSASCSPVHYLSESSARGRRGIRRPSHQSAQRGSAEVARVLNGLVPWVVSGLNLVLRKGAQQDRERGYVESQATIVSRSATKTGVETDPVRRSTGRASGPRFRADAARSRCHRPHRQIVRDAAEGRRGSPNGAHAPGQEEGGDVEVLVVRGGKAGGTRLGASSSVGRSSGVRYSAGAPSSESIAKSAGFIVLFHSFASSHWERWRLNVVDLVRAACHHAARRRLDLAQRGRRVINFAALKRPAGDEGEGRARAVSGVRVEGCLQRDVSVVAGRVGVRPTTCRLGGPPEKLTITSCAPCRQPTPLWAGRATLQ